jgi:ubiquitin-conjugating enzyme E2 I
MGHLMNERKEWKKKHPFGFFALPKMVESSGGVATDMFCWEAGIPGRDASDYPLNSL